MAPATEGRLNVPKANRTHTKPVWKRATADHFSMWSRACQSELYRVPWWAPECKPAPCPTGVQPVAPRSRIQSVLNGYHGIITLWYSSHKSAWTLAKQTTMARYAVVTPWHGTVRYTCSSEFRKCFNPKKDWIVGIFCNENINYCVSCVMFSRWYCMCNDHFACQTLVKISTGQFMSIDSNDKHLASRGRN